MNWCVLCARDQEIRCRTTAERLDDALYQGRSFAEDLHRALNPEGAETLERTPQPPRELDGGKPHFVWSSLVGRVWYHDDPSHHFTRWRTAVERKEIVYFPRGCNKEALIFCIDEYFRQRWLSHSWLDWMFLDALIRHEAVALADEINLLQMDVLSPTLHYRSRLAMVLAKKSNLKRAQAIEASTQPHQQALLAIAKVYAGLAGMGQTISPTRVRETMTAAEAVNVRWDPVCYALIDNVISKDAVVWQIGPPPAMAGW